MVVYVLNKDGKPVMPCSPGKAKHLLRSGDAKCIRVLPFTIKLTYQIEEPRLQDVTLGVDAGSKVIGSAATTNGKVVYQAETSVRQDVSKKMTQRKMLRGTRRGKKTRYRPARWLNRKNSTKKDRVAPSVKSKLWSHLREISFVNSILPIAKLVVETAQFNIHKISNPDVEDYGSGKLKGFYNAKAYILSRDGYKCQHCKKKGGKLQVHHIIFRSDNGTDEPKNLVTLCADCHTDLHAGKFEIKGKKSATKHATEVGILSSQLRKLLPNIVETFGYETKFKREQILKLPKSHANDAISICSDEGEILEAGAITYAKRHVSSGDYKQTRGSRSEQKLPTGKLFGFRKHDKVRTPKGVGFIKGKRSTGYFDVETLSGLSLSKGISHKKIERIKARATTLIESSFSSPQ